MMRVATSEAPQPFRDIDLGDLLRPNLGELLRVGVRLPLRIASLARQVVSQPGQVSVLDLALGLAQALPSGLYTGAGIEGYLHTVLGEPGRTDDFRELRGGRELYITATDLDTCERVVFGAEGFDALPHLHRRARLRGAADGVRPRAARRPRAGGRGADLHHQPRHRRRGRRQARGRDQPRGAVRQRLRRRGAHAARAPPAARLGHGLPADRLPGVQAARPPAAARDGHPLGGALPRGGHRADRARRPPTS